MLYEVKFGCKVTPFCNLYHHLMLHYTHRCTIVTVVCTATKGDVMILNEACSRNSVLKIRVISAINHIETKLLCRTNVVAS